MSDEASMTDAAGNAVPADRNLLFGILALRMALITREQLDQALQTWTADKTRALADILLEQGALDRPDRDLIDRVVARHLLKHAGDLSQSLAAIHSDQLKPPLATSLDGSHTSFGPQSRSHFDPGDELLTTSDTLPIEPEQIRYFGDYQLLGMLGRGGMGLVYKARQVSLDRIVALKMILAGQLSSHEQVARFRTEAQAAATLDHPGIVPIFEVGEHQSQHFFSMGFVDGPSLAAKLQNGPLAPKQAAALVRKIALAVQHAHEHGIVHRDLKPANVLIGPNSEPKLTDFGVAKRLEGDADLTATGEIIGTPSFMSPEQAAGKSKELGPPTDIYALGAILYALLAGRPPFQADSAADTLAQIIYDDPAPLRRLNASCPRDLETICLKCLHKTPARRYASAGELAADLQRWLDHEPIQARPTTSAERLWLFCRRRPTTAAVVLVSTVLILLGLLVGYELRLRQQAEFLVERLLEAETAAVPAILHEMAEHPQYVLPLLKRAQADVGQPMASREALHVSLALLPSDDAQLRYLEQRLLHANPQELPIVRTVLEPCKTQLIPNLWREAEQTATHGGDGLLQVAAALASYDRHSPRWKKIDVPVVDALVRQSPLHLTEWCQSLQPAHEHLVTPLAAVVSDRNADRSAMAKELATIVLREYAADVPELLAEVAMNAQPRQFLLLLPALEKHRSAAIQRFRAELSRRLSPQWQNIPLQSEGIAPDTETVKQIESAQGLLAERFACCQAMKIADFLPVSRQLWRSGYRPSRCRPYAAARGTLVAAVWARDGRQWQAHLGLSAGDILSRAEQQLANEFIAVDVAGYLDRDQGRPVEHYGGLWAKRMSDGEDARIYVGVSYDDHDEVSRSIENAGFSCQHALQAFWSTSGDEKFCGVKHRTGGFSFLAWSQTRREYQAKDYPDRIAWDLDICAVRDVAMPAEHNALAGDQRNDSQGSDEHYASVWQTSMRYEAMALCGLSAQEHLARCRQLVSEDYRPVAISVASTGRTDTLQCASVWHRPLVLDSAKEQLAQRQAAAAVALLRLNGSSQIWSLLRYRSDPRLRSWMIDRFAAMGFSVQDIIERLEDEEDPDIRQALILCLRHGDGITPDARQRLIRRLLQWYEHDPHPGIHSSARWLLCRWGQAGAVASIDHRFSTGKVLDNRRWYVTSQGQTMTLVRGPVEFLMGSPATEPGRDSDECLHRKRIGHSFAIAATEVTTEQLKRFWNANPSFGPFRQQEQPPKAAWVTWYEAAAYCRWLSEQENVPEDQMCYPSISMIKDKMRLPVDYLERTGYRLPTEAEWECACRAGTHTSRYYGEDDRLLPHYAWYIRNGSDGLCPVAALYPNAWGLFDVYGSTWEWCQDAYDGPTTTEPALTEDTEQNTQVVDEDNRVLRGGSRFSLPRFVRSANRKGTKPTQRDLNGFRIARTHR